MDDSGLKQAAPSSEAAFPNQNPYQPLAAVPKQAAAFAFYPDSAAPFPGMWRRFNQAQADTIQGFNGHSDGI